MTSIIQNDDSLPTSAQLIEIPIPSIHSPTQLVCHVTQFKGRSLLIWCGEANQGLANALLSHQTSQSGQSQSTAPTQPKSSLLIEEVIQPSNIDQPKRQQSIQAPTGMLGNEWSVAMTSTSQHNNTISTSLFRSNLDISKPMASRLSKRFQISQLFLSLSLPDQLLAMLDGPFQDPLGGKALMLVEGALGNIIKSTLEEKVAA